MLDEQDGHFIGLIIVGRAYPTLADQLGNLQNRLLDSTQDATSLHRFATMVRSGLGQAAGRARSAAHFVSSKLPFKK